MERDASWDLLNSSVDQPSVQDCQALHVHIKPHLPTQALVLLPGVCLHPHLGQCEAHEHPANGAKHFLQMVMMVDKYCLEEEKDLLEPILQFNGYQAHPECVILSMLSSAETEERKRGVDLIMKIRKKKEAKPRGRKKIRKFKVFFQSESSK